MGEGEKIALVISFVLELGGLTEVFMVVFSLLLL